MPDLFVALLQCHFTSIDTDRIISEKNQPVCFSRYWSDTGQNFPVILY